MTYKDTKQTQERYAIKKSSKWKTAGSVLVASLIFGSSVVLNENKASADETNTESTLSTVTTGETTADLIEESVQTEDSSNTSEKVQTLIQVLQLRHPTRFHQQQVQHPTQQKHRQVVKHLISQAHLQLQKPVLLKLLQQQIMKLQKRQQLLQMKEVALVQAPLKRPLQRQPQF